MASQELLNIRMSRRKLLSHRMSQFPYLHLLRVNVGAVIDHAQQAPHVGNG